MREIKSRAWDKETCQMFYPMKDSPLLSVDYCELKLLVADITNGSAEEDDYIVMQYTGLKDKNGVEIYESDVIHCIGDTFPAVVVFDEKALRWSAQLYHHGVKNELMTLARYIYSRERAVRSKIEVIGNIHENSELLK